MRVAGPITSALAVATLVSAPARAQSLPSASASMPRSIAVVVRGDADLVDQRAMLDILRLEFATDGVRRIELLPDLRGAEDATVRVSAVPETAHVRVRLDHLARGLSVEREIDLTDVPARSRSRTVALGVAELVRASWPSLDASPDPPVAEDGTERTPGTIEGPASPGPPITHTLSSHLSRPRPSAPTSPRTPDAAVTRHDVPTLDAALLARGFPLADLPLFGGQVRFGIPLAPPPSLRMVGAAGFTGGSAHHRLGHVELLALTGALGLELALSAGDWTFAFGPRVAVGWSHARGTPTMDTASGGEGDAGFLLLAFAGEVAVRIVGPLRVAMGVELGFAPLGVRALADDVRAVGIEELLLSAWIGPGVRFE